MPTSRCLKNPRLVFLSSIFPRPSESSRNFLLNVSRPSSLLIDPPSMGGTWNFVDDLSVGVLKMTLIVMSKIANANCARSILVRNEISNWMNLMWKFIRIKSKFPHTSCEVEEEINEVSKPNFQYGTRSSTPKLMKFQNRHFGENGFV